MQNMDEIYRKYSEFLYKYVFCLTGNEDITEEIVQETFLVAVKNSHRFRGECKISTWLCQISKYIWYKRLRKEKQKKEIPIQELENLQSIEQSIEENFCNQEKKIALFKKITKSR